MNPLKKILLPAIVIFNFALFNGLSANSKDSKVVLSLRYIGSPLCQVKGRQYLTSLFESEGIWHYPQLAGTDWEGRIYFIDTFDIGEGILRAYDKKGCFVKEWQPFSIGTYEDTPVAITKSGYIWIGFDNRWGKPSPGPPILIYKFEFEEAIRDLRKEPPEGWDKKLKEVLKDEHIKNQLLSPELGRWRVSFIWAAVNKVVFVLGNERIPTELGVMVWISEDGSKVFDMKLVKLWSEEAPYLAPDGSEWIIKDDLHFINEFDIKWSKLWVYPRSKKLFRPLIDLSHSLKPFGDKMKLEKNLLPPKVYIDAKGHIYLQWWRHGRMRSLNLSIEGKVVEVGERSSEKALMIVDFKGDLISYIPWTPTSFEVGDTWIKPLPDGSGFYRMEFSEREARVYFHPLPK